MTILPIWYEGVPLAIVLTLVVATLIGLGVWWNKVGDQRRAWDTEKLVRAEAVRLGVNPTLPASERGRAMRAADHAARSQRGVERHDM